jgi:hypothetical protein
MSRYRWFIGFAGMLCLVSGCNSKTAKQPPAVDVTNSAETPVENSADQAAPLASQDFFPDPLVAGSATVKPLPMPNLIPPTTSTERVPQVDTGRPDPFASLGLTPTVVQTKPPAPPAVLALPAAPVISVAALPQAPAPLPLPPLIPAAENFTLPTLNIPSQTLPQRSLAETIEISGIVEVGGKKSVIIKAPDEHTSRYVTVGDRLGNGTVLVKRVEMGLEPVVILEQGGREIVRSIGASSALVGAM